MVTKTMLSRMLFKSCGYATSILIFTNWPHSLLCPKCLTVTTVRLFFLKKRREYFFFLINNIMPKMLSIKLNLY